MGRRAVLLSCLLLGLILISIHSEEPSQEAAAQGTFPPYTLYRGNLHSHSWLSGDVASPINTPAYVYNLAQNAGFHFWALTDHTAQPCPPQFRPSRLTNADWRDVRLAAAEATKPGQFVALAGFEWTGTRTTNIDCDIWYGRDVIGVGHMNVIEPNSTQVAVAVEPLSRSQIYAYLRTVGTAWIQFNHPAIYPGTDNFSAFTLEADIDQRFPSYMELGTGMYNGSIYSPRRGNRSETEFWYRLALRRGWHVGATNNQDNHLYGGGFTVNHTGVWATSLTRAGLLDALRNRRTFASEDPTFRLWFTANDAPMGSLCVPNKNGIIQFAVLMDDEVEGSNDYNVEAVIIGGRIGDPSSLRIVAQLPLNDGIHFPSPIPFEQNAFYYVRIRQADGWGDLVFSSPVWTCSVEQPSAEILIADAGMNVARLIRATDLSGSGWTTFGSFGGGVNQFGNPLGVAVDGLKRIYIADQTNHRIVRIDNMLGTGWLAFGTDGNGINQFYLPSGVAIDQEGRILVVDHSNHRIVRINDMTGAGWITFGQSGSGQNQFSYPAYVAVDSLDRIYVTDENNSRIVRIDDMTGSGWKTFGMPGSGVSQFSHPLGIALDNTNRVYVTDFSNNRIVKIDNMDGAGWTTFGTAGSGVNQFNGPHEIVVDSIGRLYVSDIHNFRLVRVDGITGSGWVSLGTFGTGTGQFSGPRGVALR